MLPHALIFRKKLFYSNRVKIQEKYEPYLIFVKTCYWSVWWRFFRFSKIKPRI